MFDKLKNIQNREEIQIDGHGRLSLRSFLADWEWFGRLKNISPDNEVEVSVEVKDNCPLTEGQIEQIQIFISKYNSLMTLLFEHMQTSFEKTNDIKTIDQLRKMYFLSALSLQKNGQEWWVVFEPAFDVKSIYNFLPRFTVKDMTVIWSNLTK